MNQRNQSPSTDKNSALSSRVSFNRDTFATKNMQPIFRFRTDDTLTTDQVFISPYRTNGKDELIIVPFRVWDSNDDMVTVIQELTDEWTIDLSVSDITLSTMIGGRVDSIAVGSEIDYLVWAFFDASLGAGGFKGFGVTTRPAAAFTSFTGTGAKGTSNTFNMSGVNPNNGFRYVVGARVIVRRGTATTDTYNQGVITAVTNTTVVVTLDSNAGYGSAPMVSGAGTIIQIDKFQPKLSASDSLYPGSGTEYTFCYMGSILSDTSNAIRLVRYRGEYLPLGGNQLFFSASNGAGTTIVTNTLTRWIPLHTKTLYAGVEVNRTAGAATLGFGVIRTESASSEALLTHDLPGITSFMARQQGFVPIKNGDCSIITANIVAGGNTQTIDGFIYGYIETEF